MPDGGNPTPENRAETNQSIRSLATRHSLGATWADAQIDAGADLPAAREAALAELDRRAETAPRIRARTAFVETRISTPSASSLFRRISARSASSGPRI